MLNIKGNKFYLELPLETTVSNGRMALRIQKYFSTDEKIKIVLDLAQKKKFIPAILIFKDEFKNNLNLKALLLK